MESPEGGASGWRGMRDSSLKPRLGQKERKRRPRVCQADKLEPRLRAGSMQFQQRQCKEQPASWGGGGGEGENLSKGVGSMSHLKSASQPYLVQKGKERGQKKWFINFSVLSCPAILSQYSIYGPNNAIDRSPTALYCYSTYLPEEPSLPFYLFVFIYSGNLHSVIGCHCLHSFWCHCLLGWLLFLMASSMISLARYITFLLPLLRCLLSNTHFTKWFGLLNDSSSNNKLI